MKSIVYFQFTDEYFDSELAPILKNFGVTLLSGDKLTIDPISYDSVIMFSDMMIKLQRDNIKKFAKKRKKPCIVLSTRYSDWSQDVIDFVEKSTASKQLVVPESNIIEVEQPLIDGEEKIDEPTVNQLKEILLKKDEELDEQKGIIQLFETDNHKLRLELEAHESVIANLKVNNSRLISKINRLNDLISEENKETADLKEYITLCETDNTKLVSQVKLQESIIYDLDTQNRKLNSTLSNLYKEILAVSVLNRNGSISDVEALEHLFSMMEQSNDS